MDPHKEVVIIGGGFGGIAAAKTFKNKPFNVTIIDRKNHHLFQPLLYQVATAALSPGDIATPIRAIFSRQNNIRTLLGVAQNIDTEKNRVDVKNGRAIPFDYLIMAPGAQYNYFGNDHWQQYAPSLKSLGDALTVRERILIALEKAEQAENPDRRVPFLTYVIIGGGPTGVETAGAIAEIAKRNMMRDFKNISPDETSIYLVEAGPKILNGYPDSLSKKAQEALESMGVSVMLNSPVTDIRENGVLVGDHKFIETRNIVWAAGVQASPLLKSLNAETDRTGRVKVNRDLSLPGREHIFIIGDAAYLEDEQGNPLPALAPVALQQGKYAGNVILNRETGKSGRPFRYVDKGTMATIGRAKAVADIRGFKLSGIAAWLMWSFIHIFFLIGFRNRFRVFAEWVWHYITFKRGVRLITERES